MATFEREGLVCAAERHLGDKGNYSFSEYDEATIERLVREVAETKPDAITIFCTNLRGALVVDRLERDLGIPIHDTVATAVWAGLRLIGESPSRVVGWGRLFREAA